MLLKTARHTLFILLLLTLTFGVDRISKLIVRHKMEDFDRRRYFGNHFIIERVENYGAFLSLGDSLEGVVRTIVLNILPLIVLVFGTGFILVKTEIEKRYLYGIILVLGGGFGNLYDRIVYGGVTDFFQIKFGILQTGVFNVADMAIMAGMIIILLNSFKKKKEEENIVTDPDVDSNYVSH